LPHCDNGKYQTLLFWIWSMGAHQVNPQIYSVYKQPWQSYDIHAFGDTKGDKFVKSAKLSHPGERQNPECI
jgi:hypothetical protein